MLWQIATNWLAIFQKTFKIVCCQSDVYGSPITIVLITAMFVYAGCNKSGSHEKLKPCEGGMINNGILGLKITVACHERQRVT